MANEVKLVPAPRHITVGKSRYTLHLAKSHRRYYGECYSQIKTIMLYTSHAGQPLPPAKRNEVLWHEITHAVLHEMGSALNNDERFVTQFSKLLSQAIDTAEF
jgi:hypothetical protein